MQRLKSKAGVQEQIYLDASLDESGWSPEALVRIVDLGTRLPYEEAAVVARQFGLDLRRSSVDDLTAGCAQACQQGVVRALNSVASAENERRPESYERPVSTMVLQVDGVYVLGRPEAGGCPGLEIKSAVLYSQSSPSQRWMLADRCKAEDFLPLLAGLLKKANVTPKDTLLGLGDGAVWIDNIFEHLQAIRITDVYHAVDYLDTLMQALGWDEPTRQAQRCDWFRGSTNARDWLRQHLPNPEAWLTWDEPALTALNYLESRLDSMDYALFTHKGYPIGSGQIEGMNKSVIGNRLKRSGMHWSEPGAASMASLRAQTCAKHPLISFETLRFDAFSLAPSSP